MVVNNNIRLRRPDKHVSSAEKRPSTIVECQEDACELPAQNHVMYGYPTFGDKLARVSRVRPYVINHHDLCAGHLEEVKNEFLDVQLAEIGQCDICHLR